MSTPLEMEKNKQTITLSGYFKYFSKDNSFKKLEYLVAISQNIILHYLFADRSTLGKYELIAWSI